MSEPTLEQVAPGGIVRLADTPGALDDAAFDALFPADGVSQVPSPSQQVRQETPASTPTQTPTQTPPNTNSEDFFVKGERSVYKTKEAVVEGLNQKDALIEQLRQRYALTTGIDPITGQPVGVNPVAAVPVLDYAQNPKQYLEDLYKAAQSGPEAYAAVQTKFMMDNLKPIQPILQNSVRQQAVEQVSKEIADFGTFHGTPGYNKALDAVPALKDAIASAESDVRFSGQLPGLYKAAYLIGKGQQLPEILAANRPANTQTPVVPSATPRTPSLPSANTGVKASFGSIEGIRQIIADQEAKGTKLDF
jgi:hypothetical protein